MNQTLAQYFGNLAAEVDEAIKWRGGAIPSDITASEILNANARIVDDAEAEALWGFYMGQQWPAEIQAIREEQHRPMLVVNRLPEMVAAACDAQRDAGLPQINADDKRELILIVTKLNRDAQCLYNYLLSTIAELAR